MSALGRRVAVLAATLGSLFPAALAGAAEGPNPADFGCGPGEEPQRLVTGQIRCTAVLDEVLDVDWERGEDRPPPVEAPLGVWRSWPVISVTPDGEPCTSREGALLDPGSNAHLERMREFWFEYDELARQGVEPGPCPWIAVSGEPPITRHVRDSVPAPTPTTNPTRGVVGKDVYLVTNGATSYPRTTFTAPIAGFDVTWEVEATGTFTVDWGDGTVTGPHASAGGTWSEGGDLTHVYIDPGTYTITVTQDWTVRYRRTSPAPQPGWSQFTMSTGPWTTPAFDVVEFQPVREY